MKLGAFIGGFLMGGFVGAALGVLTAPKAGTDLRHQIAGSSENLYRKAAYELEELAHKVEELKDKLEGDINFAPTQLRVGRKIDQAHEAMQQTEHTTAQSQYLLDAQENRQRLT